MSGVAQIVDLALRRSATLGSTRLVCVDGPAGSGKTTLAGALVDTCSSAGLSTALVHMDDVYDGWDGLRRGGGTVRRSIVQPLAEGRPASYRRYDWAAGRYAESRDVPPVDVLLVEGVGSGHLGYADHITVLVWVDAPRDLRLRRGLERDGEALRSHWLRWMAEESRLHDEERTRARADVLVDGADGSLVPASGAGSAAG